MRRLGRWLVFFLVSASSTAEAGNDDEVLFGAAASLTAGAVVATVETGAALWYNPAGIVALGQDTLDVSGSAYTLRLHRTADLLSTTAGRVASGNVTEIAVVPAALSYVRPLSGSLRLGFGLFVPSSADYVLRARLEPTPAQPSQWSVMLSERRSEYHAMAGLAWRAHPKLRVGFALIGVYWRELRSGSFAGLQPNDDGFAETFVTASTDLDASGAGLSLSAGIQWNPMPWLKIGASIRAPTVLLYVDARLDEIQAISEQTQNAVSLSGEVNGADFQMVQPARIRLGTGVELGRFLLSGDIDYQHAMSNEAFAIDRPGLVNARVGVRLPLSDSMDIGAGLFTDRTTAEEPSEFLDSRANFYGATVGLSLQSDRNLDKEKEDVSKLTFGTTFALRYAYGSGSVGGLLLDETFAGEEIVRIVPVGLKIHEISLYTAARVQF